MVRYEEMSIHILLLNNLTNINRFLQSKCPESRNGGVREIKDFVISSKNGASLINHLTIFIEFLKFIIFFVQMWKYHSSLPHRLLRQLLIPIHI